MLIRPIHTAKARAFGSTYSSALLLVDAQARNNPVWRRYRLTFLERPLADGISVWRRVLGVFALSIALIGTLTVYAQAGYLTSAPQLPIASHTGFLDLLAIQATIAALTFPIGLAMASVLLSAKTRSFRLSLYMAYSGGLSVGAFSFALMATLLVFLLIESSLGVFERTAALIVTMLWLLGNVAETVLFLTRTLSFVDHLEQQRTVLRYAIDVCWRWSLVEKLAQARMRAALQGRQYSQNLRIDSGEVNSQVPSDRITKLVWPGRQFNDLYLYPFNRAIQRIAKRVANLTASTPDAASQATLRIAPWPGRRLEGCAPVAALEGRAKVGLLAGVLLRASFRTSWVKKWAPMFVAEDIHKAYVDEAVVDIASGNPGTFSEAMSRARSLLTAWLAASDHIADATVNFGVNVADTGDEARGMLQRNRSAFDAAFEHHWDDITYLRDVFRHSASLLSRYRGIGGRNRQAYRSLASARDEIESALARWWIARQGSGAGQGRFEDRGRTGDYVSQQYAAMWQLHVGAGAAALRSAVYEVDSPPQSWSELVTCAPMIVDDLQRTCGSLLRAVRRGDRTGALWSRDAVQRWPEALLSRQDLVGSDLPQGPISLPELMRLTEREARDELSSSGNRDLASGSVLRICLSSAQQSWHEYVIASLAVLMLWSRENGTQDTLASEVASQLWACAPVPNSGDHSVLVNVRNAAECIHSFLRIRDRTTAGRRYNWELLDGFLRGLARSEPGLTLTGRNWSGWQRYGIVPLTYQHLLLLVASCLSDPSFDEGLLTRTANVPRLDLFSDGFAASQLTIALEMLRAGDDGHQVSALSRLMTQDASETGQRAPRICESIVTWLERCRLICSSAPPGPLASPETTPAPP